MKYILSNSQFFHQKFGGVTRYSVNIFKKMITTNRDVGIIAPLHKNRYLNSLEHKNKFGVYCPKYPNLKLLRYFNNIYLKKRILKDNTKSIHYCYYPEKLIKSTSKKILTIHDLIHEKKNKEYKQIDFEFRKKILENTDEFICVSKKTKKDLIQYYDIKEENIHVIYHGSDHINQIDESEVNIDYLNEPYLLFVGFRKKYKNFKIFLDVFLDSQKLYRDFRIICFGNEKLQNKDEQKLFLNDKLKLLNGNDSLLKQLYLKSSGLICTSLDEGFGLPILESMALSCNVFAPNIEVFKEIYKDNIFYYEVNNKESFKSILENYLYDIVSLEKKKKIAKNFSKNFTWKSSAEQTLKTYY